MSKKNPKREATIIRTRIIQKYGVNVTIKDELAEVTITKNGQEIKRFYYENTEHLVQILRNIYETGLDAGGTNV